jgi:hypothetical protein
MPDYRFTAPIPYDYPASRDSYGVPLGTVKPGDVLRLDGPPDMWWVPWESGSDDGEPPQAVTDPAAPDEPAQTSEAGVTGSEES